MAEKKTKARRKRYATEFLVRSDNPTLIAELKEVADKKRLSVNGLILNEVDKIIARNKK